MAYENYSFVSWTDGTPLSSDRLAQMSTNIEQVKTATDDKAFGILALKNVSSNTASTNAYTESKLVGLEDEGGGGSDNRVTISGNRYYRITLNFPGIVVTSAGGEDANYVVKIKSGTFTGSNTTLASYYFTIPPYSYINVASAVANIANEALKTTTTYPTRVGAGTYSIVLTTDSSGLTNQSFFCTLQRNAGASTNRPTSFFVPAADATMQLYVEDAGGTV